MNLTPEQLELLYFLLGALAIGFLFGYLLARARASKRYESELNEYSDLLDLRDKEIISYSAKNGKLKQHLADQASELQLAHEKVSTISSSMNDYENKISIINEDKERAELLLEQKLADIGEKENKLTSASDELMFVKSELEKRNRLVDEHKIVINEQKTKLITAHSELEKNVQNYHQKSQVIEDAHKKIEHLEREKHELKNQIQNFSKDEQKGEQTKQELERYTQALHREKEEKLKLVTELDKVKKESAIKIEQIASTKDTSSVDVANLNLKLQEKEEELKKHKQLSEIKEREIASINAELVKKHNNVQDLEKKLQKTQSELVASTSQPKEQKPVKHNLTGMIEDEEEDKGWGLSRFAKGVMGKLGDDKKS